MRSPPLPSLHVKGDGVTDEMSDEDFYRLIVESPDIPAGESGGFRCPQCGSRPDQWARDPEDRHRILCNRDGALVAVECCPVEREHCSGCGKARVRADVDDYSSCCRKLFTIWQNCKTYDDHHEENR